MGPTGGAPQEGQGGNQNYLHESFHTRSPF
jgi:hypothetical protein